MHARFVCAAVVVAAAGSAGAQTFDLETLVHGEIITNQFEPALAISAVNFTGPDIAAIYDTTTTGGADPDLEDPWSGGNLAASTFLGNMLIIAENDTDLNNDGILDNPDDEGGRPAGTITLEFENAVSFFGFDFVDIEDNIQETSSLDFFVNGSLLGSVSFADFMSGGTFDNGVVFGNNFANRVAPIQASSFGALGFDTVVINVGGSAAFDNFLVPAPSGVAVLGLGVLAAARRRR